MCQSAISTVANLIKSRILLSGPIPVADYMRLALTAQSDTRNLLEREKSKSSFSGYYMKKDVFGAKGDFITSPEISQLFGEMLAVWGLQTWMQIGGPKKFSIVEFGPGRGTLSKDVLRVFKQFEHITGNNVSLHLVEISPFLATLQCSTLTSTSLEEKGISSGVGANKVVEKVESIQLLDPLKETSDENSFYHKATTAETWFPVYWYRDIKDVPQDFHFYFAHEFFDALPFHKLQKVEGEWREVLVDVNLENDNEFRFVVSRNETPVIKLLQQSYSSILQDPRQHIEVSIEQLSILENLSNRLDVCGGIVNIIDYGHDGIKGDTFRAFYKHKLFDPLKEPGKADLTTDVDFSIIRKLFDNRAMICGPVTQLDFLTRIGIAQRLKILLNNSKSEEEKKSLITGHNMIMNEMGSRFHVMSMLPKVVKKCMPDYIPIGFSSKI